MGRVRKREMDLLFGPAELFDGGFWPIALDYIAFHGRIWPDGTGWRRTGHPTLGNADAFLSFARLSARGGPSTDRILDWVRKYGLLHKADVKGDLAFLPDGTVNQAPMSIDTFQKESGRAYRLLRIFELSRGDVSALRPRMDLRILLPDQRSTWALTRVFLDGEPTPCDVDAFRDDGSRVEVKDLADEVVREACTRYIKAIIEPDIAGMHPVFGSSGRLALRCPDLRTALYWQFAALVGDKLQSAICEGCGAIFTRRRRDQKVCDDTCRSRKARTKGQKLGGRS